MTGIRFIPSSTGASSRVGIGLSSIVGATGARGYQGFQGPAGVASMTGATGFQGFQGLIGATGTGFQGFQGLIGATGPSNPGVQGFQGLIGATGPSNPGVQGFQGLIGATGAVGQSGLQGIIGATGSIGLQGYQGLAGSTGAAGSIGPQGSAGMGFVVFANANSYTGLNTVIATGGNVGQFVLVLGGDLFVYSGTGAGSTGPGVSYQYAGDITDESKLVGMQGFQGLMGSTGDRGYQGLQGAIYTGPFVDISFSGNMSGANAYLQNLAAQNSAFQGSQVGFNGLLVVGPTTLIGSLQATGGINAPSATIKNLVVTSSIILPTGTSLAGPQGTQGLVGLQGTQGLVGLQGTQGLVGLQGTQGLAGLQGTQGLAGLQGSQYTGPFTSLTVSGTSYLLGEVISSGNMSGANAYFQNMAAENLAAQGAEVGFNGLLVVGDETVIGTLNATGGLTTTTATANNATIKNLVVTSSIILPTGTSLAGPQGTQGLAGLQGTQGLVGLQGTQGLAGLQGSQGLIGLQGSQYTGPFTELTVSGTSYLLGDVISSGNMSGTNAYFQNLASQNIASQGSQVGFNGLLVVGGTTLIGALQATGGLTTTTATANSATIKNLVVTSSIVLPTGTSLAGPQGSQGLAGPQGSQGLVGLQGSQGLAGLQGSQGLIGLQGSQYTGPFTELTVSGTSYLTDVLASGNMSGANAYFQNLAAQNIASQGSQVGFNGLLVVGNTRLIGTLTATGGVSTIKDLVVTNNATIPSLSSTSVSSSTIYTDTINNLSSSTLNIGGSSTSTINIGAPGLTTQTINIGGIGDTVNVAGTLTYINSTDLRVTDNQIVINDGNTSIVNSGIIISLTGTGGPSTGAYILVNSNSNGFIMKAGSGQTINLNQDIGTGSSPSFNNLTTTSLTSTSANIETANITTIPSTTITTLSAPLLSSTTGTVTNLTSTSALLTTATIPTLSSTTGTITNLTSTSALLTTATIPTLSSTTATVSGTSYLTDVLSSGNMSGANAYFQNMAAQNIASQGSQVGFNGLLVVGGTTLIGSLQATGGLSAPTATITTETVNSSTITNLTATTATIPTLSSTTGTISNLTSTTANIGTANITTIPTTIIGSFTATTGTITNLTTTNATMTNLTVTNLVVGGETGGNLYLGTGVITNLTVGIETAGTIIATTGTITNLTSTNLRATTATISGTSYLTDTISSGNMSGANGYFLNLAGQNLACQGANVGFSGLNVVGTSSLIGMMYATGGINSQGVTTTTLNATTGSITNLSAGNILPLANDTYTLGSTGAIWKSIYVGTGSLHIGNVTLSAPDNQSLSIDKPVLMQSLDCITAYIGNSTITSSLLSSSKGSITSLTSNTMTGTTAYITNLTSNTMTGNNGYFNKFYVSYSGSTGSSNAVYSDTQRGKGLILSSGNGGSTNTLRVWNSLVNVETSVFATITPYVAGSMISGVDVNASYFDIYLAAPGAPTNDTYINWFIVN